MSGHKKLLACMMGSLGVSVTLACGPDFPWQLLDDRQATLAATPANSFAFEAAHLVPTPPDSLKAMDGEGMLGGAPTHNSLSPIETVGLSPAQVDALRRMRAANTGDQAFADGAEVPQAIRLYTAGAVAFHALDLTQALARFQVIEQLPEDERAVRITWATYMLGRSYARLGESEKAAQAFQQTRALAINGAPDPLGLAVASYGEEAKLHLNRAQSYITADGLPTERENDYAREIATTVILYAEQAARGSMSGISSLRIVAEQLLYPPTRLPVVVADPTVQRLLVTYVLAVLNNAPSQPYEPEVSQSGQRDEPEANESNQSDETEANEARQPDKPEANKSAARVQPDLLLVTLVGAIEQHGLDHPQGADHLAALAYRIGRYDLAAQLAAYTSGPLASWIKAKLAVQKGDFTTAAASYAKAIKAFPTVDGANPLEERSTRLLKGEGGVLALARGDYVDALAQLYSVASTYWGDVAYLAERVLTVNELQHFVDAEVPPQKVKRPKLEPGDSGTSTEEEALWLAPDPAAQLRDLLARRLVREGRYQEALPYFHAEDDLRFTDAEIRTHATAYVEALRKAEHGWWANDRAQGWYKAAVLARKFGMEMMGYETAPDFFVTGGAYDFGYGQSALPASFVTGGERQRFTVSAAQPDLRFHYRSLALQYGNYAADLLPPRSQAFAAVLCQAAEWAHGTPEGRDIYRRYVQQGPYVPWAAHFGRNCPAPDFTAAVHMARQQPFQAARRFARRYRRSIIIAIVAIMGLVGAALVWFVQQRSRVQTVTEIR